MLKYIFNMSYLICRNINILYVLCYTMILNNLLHTSNKKISNKKKCIAHFMFRCRLKSPPDSFFFLIHLLLFLHGIFSHSLAKTRLITIGANTNNRAILCIAMLINLSSSMIKYLAHCIGKCYITFCFITLREVDL